MSKFSDAVLALFPWAYYPMDEETTSGSIIDASPNTRVANFVGTRADFEYTDAHPNFERGIAFQSSSRAVLPTRPNFIGTDRTFTVGFVGRLPVNTDWFHPILGNTAGSIESGYALNVDTRAGIGRENAIIFGIMGSGSVDTLIVENAIPDADDHFYTLEADGTTFRVYCDNVLMGQATLTAKTATAGDDVTIGAVEFNNTWYDAAPNGLGQFFLLERPLTDGERAELYAFATEDDNPPAGTYRDWTPADIAEGLDAWFDADDADTVTIDGNGKVSAWNSKGDDVLIAQQTTEAARPGRNPNAINGRAAIDFDGINDRLVLDAVVAPGESRTEFVVFRRASTGIHSIGLSRLRTSALQGEKPYPFWWFNTDDVVYSALGDDFTTHGTADTRTGVFIGVADRDDSAARVWLNGTQQGADQTPTAVTSESYGAIGNNYNSYHSGFIAEILSVPGKLSDDDRQKCEGYLAHKWGLADDLPSDHPYKSAAPQVFVPGVGGGQITGTVTVNGSPAVRQIIGITYLPQTITPETGDPYEARQIVGETVSAEDGTYTLDTGSFLDETIVLALEDYGTVWKPNRTLEVGDRIRPTQPNQNGYVYQVTIAGNSGTEEPEWIIPTGAVTTMDVGDATVQGLPMFWSLAHAPIVPAATGAPIDPVPTDPLWDQVTLLIDAVPPEGLNTILDRSTFERTITAYGNAALSEEIEGIKTVKFDGNGDFLGVQNDTTLFDAAGLWTIEGFIYPTLSQIGTIFSTRNETSANRGFWLTHGTDGSVGFTGITTTGTSAFNGVSEAGDLTADTLQHVAVVSDSLNVRAYIAGVKVLDLPISGTLAQGDPILSIGRMERSAGQLYFNGHMTNIRIVPQVRYTDNFTPPEPPFPQQ
jgi:hypothetical protein